MCGYYKSNKIMREHLQSDENMPDIFTKPCRKSTLQKFKDYLFGLRPNMSSYGGI